MEILNYWPFEYQPRKNQIYALEWLGNQQAKFLMLQAPVGSGKSNIGLTYSSYLADTTRNNLKHSFILTPQRILQDQYERSFHNNKHINLVSLYGKSNYTCRGKDTTCDIGSLIKPKCASCPAAQAKKNALDSNNVVLNYKLALTSFAYTDSFKPRNLMVMDECHTLENHLVEFDALTITEKRCKRYELKFKKHQSTQNAIEWMQDYYIPELSKVESKLEQQCEEIAEKRNDEITRKDIGVLREFNGLQEHLDEARTMILRKVDYIDEHYVLGWTDNSFEFKKLSGSQTFFKYIVPNADKFLFMSSTILDKKGFCEDLGIPDDQAAFLSLDSEFPVKNRQVFYFPQMKMNYKWRESENESKRREMLRTVDQLLTMHKDESGIIHTGNFQVAEWLVENLKIKHNIYHHNPQSGDDRNAVITAFMGDPKPSVLISPSSTEGLDLKDDLGRFAIFVKVPFGQLNDQWIKRKMELSNRWYQRRALIDVIQGGGRVVRTPNDWGNVYILDESWSFLYKAANEIVPMWWKESYSRL